MDPRLKSILLRVPLAALAVPSAAGQAPLLTLPGPNGFANYGWSLAGAGDIDQDGVPDVVLGGLQAFPSKQFSGGVFLHSGRTGGLLKSWFGPNGGAEYGHATASGADVDQDGTNDVLVGAPSYQNPSAGLANHGRVELLSGSTGGTLFAFEGDSSGDALGIAVAIVGDTNADGFVDLLAGAPDDDDFGPSSGSLRLWSGATGAARFTIHGQDPGGYYGSSVTDAGDLDQDGFDDLFVGAWGHGFSFTGMARVLDGQSGAPLKTWFGTSGDDELGYALARVGDVSGDGIPDLAISSPGADVTLVDDGRVLVVSGAGGATLFQLHGAASGASLGWAIAGFEADGDGVADLAIGRSNGVSFVSGATQTSLAELQPATAALFGKSVAGVGDLDGDGFDDVAVGDPAADPAGIPDAGMVTVWPGCATLTPYGVGCPGTGGFVPAIGFDRCPAAGATTTFTVEQGLGGAPALVLVGATPASVPAGGGCTLLVLPIVAQVVLPLGGAGPGAGSLALPLTVPAGAAGASATLQAFVADGGTGTGTGFASSAGLELDL